MKHLKRRGGGNKLVKVPGKGRRKLKSEEKWRIRKKKIGAKLGIT